jgi:hypothetical protein
VLEGERIDQLLTRAVDLLDCLREQVRQIGAAEPGCGLGPARSLIFEQIDAARTAVNRAKVRTAY